MVRPSRRARSAVVAAALVVAGAAMAGCTSSSSSDAGSSSPDGSRPETEEQFVDWFGKVTEVVVACNTATQGGDETIDAHAAAGTGEDENLSAVLVAGQAVEHCGLALDPGHALVAPDELAATWADGTAKVTEWLDVMEGANRAAVLVSAGTMDSRPLVAELFGAQTQADTLADELDVLVTDRAVALGIDAPEGLGLYRWSPPDH